MNLNKKNIILWAKKVFICTLSIFLLGLSGAINIKADLGADPITVFYDGVSNFFHTNLGMTINLINFALTVVVFFVKRKYIHIGTLIYVVLLGVFVNMGVYFYDLCCIPSTWIARFLVSIFGCILAFIGIGMYISIDIGVDPWSAASLIICQKTGKSFRLIRFLQDAITLIIGISMGGTFGIITVVCVIVGGPAIQKVTEFVDKTIKLMIKSNCEN